MQTWQIMMGLNLLSVLVCLAAVIWFRFRKNDDFDDFIDDNSNIINKTNRQGGVAK